MSNEDFLLLLKICETDEQRDIVRACAKHGINPAAKLLNLNRRSIQRRLEKLRNRLAKQGVSPEHDMTHEVPRPFVVSGISTLYNAEGKVSAQWVKSKLSEEESFQAMREAIDDLVSEYRGIAKPIKPPPQSNEDILCIYPMGDPHVGLYAHGLETGSENFDTTIARNDLLAAVSRLVSVAPPSKRALIVNLGDFFHADSFSQLTKSGHKLDVDTRWPKVLKVGCQLMVDLISLALTKHAEVEVINAIGNHDDHSSVMLAAFLEAWFHDEPRVKIQPTASKFHYVEFGKNLIGVTHGDTVKHTALGELMASDMPDAWGRTTYRYWYTGHIHHTSKTELRGAVVESFRTLAARDAWHSASGYRSGRDMYAIVLSKEHGEVERHRCDIRQIRG